jgi:HEAT repeat protein
VLCDCYKLQVRDAAAAAARAVMANISGPGVKLVLPTLLKGLEERAWRSKQASIQLLGAMSNCAPQQLATSLPSVVPALAAALGDAHPKVNAAAKEAIEQIGAAVRNPEVRDISGSLIKAIADPVRSTRPALEHLRDTVFVHTVDVSALSLILPVVLRGMKERVGESKKHAARILGNLASLISNPRDLVPYMSTLLPELKALLVDPLPEVRATAARSLGAIVRGLGPEHVEEMLPWLLETLASETSSVERSGAALGLAEVVAVLGEEHLAALLPGVIAGCSDHSMAVRDGNLTLLVHLPVACKRIFEPHLEQALPCILEGLADEAEEVRSTAMAAATKVVELYAVTRTPLLLPVLEVGLQEENWRIRESSVKLLGELLYKIAGTSGKVRLDGGDDEEGAATEAYAHALLDTLGEATRNDVLAYLYLARCTPSGSSSLSIQCDHGWKSWLVAAGYRTVCVLSQHTRK